MSRIHTIDSIAKLLNELQISYNKADLTYQPVLTSGFFDPIHSSHIEYLKSSTRYGNIWITALNNNDCCVNKKGFYFLDENERANILSNLSWVHYVIIWPKNDVSEVIKAIKPKYFTNGGDRTVGNKEEDRACREVACKQVFGVGGSQKVQSSTKILESFLERYAKVNNTMAGIK